MIKIQGDIVINNNKEWDGNHFIPSNNGSYNLGSSQKEWKDLYIDGIANIDTLKANALGANIDHANYNSTNVDINSGHIANAVTLDKTITLTGAVTGSVNIGSGNASISTTVNHTHDLSDLTNKYHYISTRHGDAGNTCNDWCEGLPNLECVSGYYTGAWGDHTVSCSLWAPVCKCRET